MYVVHRGLLLRLPLGLVSAPVRTRGGGDAAVWVAGALAAPGTQVSHWGGQQEIWGSYSVFQPLATLCQWILSMEVAWMLGSQLPWQCWVHRGDSHYYHRRYDAIRAFSSLCQLCPSEDWVWRWWNCLDCGDPDGPKCSRHWLPHLQQLWPYQSLYQVSGSWQSEGLFGWSFSVAWPIHTLKGHLWLW